MTTPVCHTVIGCEYESSSVVGIKVLDKLYHLLHALVHHLKIMEVFFGIWSVRVTGCVKTKQMKEENHLILTKSSIEGLVRGSCGEEIFDMVEDPIIKLSSILGEILKLSSVCEGIYPARNSTVLKHG
ncbi:hypothetical protein HG530_000049 [Fusarium avenaceum]|nr:hypothetical protein HG530_000049 [Fusarium avenaceum]